MKEDVENVSHVENVCINGKLVTKQAEIPPHNIAVEESEVKQESKTVKMSDLQDIYFKEAEKVLKLIKADVGKGIPNYNYKEKLKKFEVIFIQM